MVTMTGKSDHFENLLQNLMFQGGPALPDWNQDTGTGMHIALFTTMPQEDSTLYVEPADASYARLTIDHGTSGGGWTNGDFGTASAAGVIQNTVAMTFVPSVGAFGTILGAGIFDSATKAAGNCLYANIFSGGSVVMSAGDTFRFAIGAFKITEN